MVSELETDRFQRQRILPMFGEAGQSRLGRATVLVAGCGALGSNLAEMLVRAGVGHILLVDHDRLELDNLHRQALLTEADIGSPKAQAVAEAVLRVHAALDVRYEIVRITRENVERLIANVDLVLDGFDNLLARYLLNDACVKHGIPWVFAAVAGTYGMVMPVIPHRGPCLRCLLPTPAPDDVVLTAQNAGMLPTLPRTIAAIQATEGFKILLRKKRGHSGALITCDIWTDHFGVEPIVRNADCPCCGRRGTYPFLTSHEGEG
jgi:molybdopterin/thiamine biosynthesis adenylyltransferase